MNDYVMEYSCASDIGMRMSNQDNYLIEGSPAFRNASEYHRKSGVLDTGELQVVCVCDGVGGGTRGDLASLIALEAIARVTGDPVIQKQPLGSVLEAAVEAAQEAVTSYFQMAIRPGGCTLVMLGIRGDEWAFMNIGDSPGFLWRHDTRQLEELSIRHNLEWEKRRRGETPDIRDGCYLLRYIGKRGDTAKEMAAVAQGTLQAGDKLLLCSDGVVNALSLSELKEALANEEDAGKVVSRAAQIPGADNCTAVCIHVKSKASQV